MRVLCASVLAFEAVVVVLLVPVAITLGGVDAATAITLGALAFVACIAIAGALPRRWAYGVGTLLQACLIATGFVVTAMFVLGALFAALWAAALFIGSRGEQVRAQRYAAAGVDDPKRSDVGRAQESS